MNDEIERLDEPDMFRERTGETVYRCCRHCNADIPPSAPNMAYCDTTCKSRSMAIEMGFGRGGEQ